MKLFSFLGIVCLALIAPRLHAQATNDYMPIFIPDSVPKAILDAYESNLDKQNAEYPDRSKKSKFFKERNQSRHDEIMDDMDNRNVYYDGPLYDYLNGVLNNILEANHKPKDIKLFPVRFTSPNACSWGEGTIYFNVGLLSRMENESQVAFVISHELAHYYAGHIAKAMERYYSLVSDKELKKEVRRISKQEYNQGHTIDSLEKTLTFRFTFHSRTSEREADTLGLDLLANTGYDSYAALRSMEILDSCDKNKYKDSIGLRSIFGFAEFPFKDKWMKYEMSDLWHDEGSDAEYSNTDTLKSHPDCKKRREYLSTFINARKLPSKNAADENQRAKFKQLILTADFEMVETDFEHENFGKSLFRTLLLLKYHPDNSYLHSMVCKNLYYLHKAQKNHHLSEVVVTPYAAYEKHYNDYLGFIQQLSLNDMASLCQYYAKYKLTGKTALADQAYAQLLAKVIKDDKDAQSLAEAFVLQYPYSRAAELAKAEFIPDIKKGKKK